ncbi:aromatic amino acid transporter [Actinobacillus delphinicola]|uniref:Aromatic amino acid permease n=1 Tax=Actinobacillus delphinicola TaxID=51161 RepID=A0A448TSK5_9PAST|nr:aromatic amino acid transporter [Actinobacillus delphinicola]VEJ08979.1 tyrosine-specific transporter [Actinobacillus delphinicola]
MNKMIGSSLIVAGTTIGGGMLAMPLTSAGIGFGFTIFLLIALWALLTYSALLFVEVYQTVESDAGIGTLAEKFFGKSGRVFATSILLIFLYALVSAYISGGSAIFAGLLPHLATNTFMLQLSGVLFTLIFGGIIFLGTSTVDRVNRLILSLKFSFFALVLLLLLPNITWQNLMEIPLNNALLISASPIFFTAFGFHGSIPSLNRYLKGNTSALRLAILIGTLIPLIAYILWQFATHGVLNQSAFLQILDKDPTLNGLVVAITQSTGSQTIGIVVRLFSALALITSFLGVALGLFETLEDLFKRMKISHSRKAVGLATFVPPLAFALFFPQGFILALGYAGQMFACYAIVLPVAMAWKLRNQYPNLNYQVIGGKPALIITLIIGISIACVPFLIQAGYLPSVIG